MKDNFPTRKTFGQIAENNDGYDDFLGKKKEKPAKKSVSLVDLSEIRQLFGGGSEALLKIRTKLLGWETVDDTSSY